MTKVIEETQCLSSRLPDIYTYPNNFKIILMGDINIGELFNFEDNLYIYCEFIL